MDTTDELIGKVVRNTQIIEIYLSSIVAYDIIFTEFEKRGGTMPIDMYDKIKRKHLKS